MPFIYGQKILTNENRKMSTKSLLFRNVLVLYIDRIDNEIKDNWVSKP